MRKIPTLFMRDPNDRTHVLPEITSGCEWVVAGEGTPTRKYDGTCVLLDENGVWWARREVKRGKAAPPHFNPVETDPATGKTFGWEPIEQSPFAKFHAEAVVPLNDLFPDSSPGTYELIGPKINGNPERMRTHQLIRHATAQIIDWPFIATPDEFFSLVRIVVLQLADEFGVEGIVWHHPDGRMAKIKARDFRQSHGTSGT